MDDERVGAPPSIRVGWELLDISRSSLANLEEGASRVVAAQIAGLVALWTQLYTFEESVPHAFAWAAWSVLVVSITWLGRMVTPRRLARFWERCRIEGRLLQVKAGLAQGDEALLIQDLGATLSAQIRALRSATHTAIVLGLVALSLAAGGYVLDKLFYEG